ncbi:MAG TPA: hypothetical protein VD999_00275 [Vitreimonas sp.]|nr:hypothetical protein [Vitreimonas sp.]
MSAELTPLSTTKTNQIFFYEGLLPFQLNEEIGVRVKHLNVLRRIAGFRQIFVGANLKGRTTRVGIIPSGAIGSELVGSSTHVEIVPTAEHKLEYAGITSQRKRAIWPTLHIELNRNEVQHRIVAGNKEITDPAGWAWEVDEALKKAIISAGMKNLMGTMARGDVSMYGVLYGVNFLQALSGKISEVSTFRDLSSDLLFILLMRYLGVNIADNIILLSESIRSKDGGPRLSMGGLWEWDRALVLWMLYRSQPIVEVMPSSLSQV